MSIELLKTKYEILAASLAAEDTSDRQYAEEAIGRLFDVATLAEKLMQEKLAKDEWLSGTALALQKTLNKLMKE